MDVSSACNNPTTPRLSGETIKGGGFEIAKSKSGLAMDGPEIRGRFSQSMSGESECETPPDFNPSTRSKVIPKVGLGDARQALGGQRQT